MRPDAQDPALLDAPCGEAVDQADPDEGWQWAMVEIFGHRQHVGRIREEERFGAKMLRIDVPIDGDPERLGWKTLWYGGSSIFSLALTDRASALRANRPYQPASPVRLPSPQGSFEYDDSDDDSAGNDEEFRG